MARCPIPIELKRGRAASCASCVKGRQLPAVLTRSVLAKAVLAAQCSSVPGAHHRPVRLPPPEREASQRAVSTDYLEERGLKEGSHGEIANERGRIVFEVGFARAICKVLKAEPDLC